MKISLSVIRLLLPATLLMLFLNSSGITVAAESNPELNRETTAGEYFAGQKAGLFLFAEQMPGQSAAQHAGRPLPFKIKISLCTNDLHCFETVRAKQQMLYLAHSEILTLRLEPPSIVFPFHYFF